jgi:hypothetical protein
VQQRPAPSLSERVANPGEGSVTIGFIDGRTQRGQIARFSPYVPDLAVVVGPPPTAPALKPTLVLIPAERVAYIAFHKRNGEHRRRFGGGDAPTLKVHVAGGSTFVVDPPSKEAEDQLGFYADAWDADQPFREFFFYAHGVNAREINRPIGEMLVQDGAIDARAISRAVDAQASQNRPQIGQILVDSGRIDQGALDHAVNTHKRRNLRLGEVLVEAGLARPEDIEARSSLG